MTSSDELPPRRRRRAIALGAVGLALAAAISVPLLAVSQADPQELRPVIAARFPDVRWVTPETLERWLADDAREVHLLDARAPAEFAVSQLRGATRIDPDEPDFEALPRIGDDVRCVVYCSVGWRSGDIAHQIRAAGHAEVYNLDGGIFRWANEGRAVYRGSTRVRDVHPYDETWGRMLNAPLRAYRAR